MNKYTSTVLFAGAGLMDMAIATSGGVVTQAVECDEKIATCYRQNFPHTRLWVSKIEATDPDEFIPTDDVHGSTSCRNASPANRNGKESDDDIQAALAFLNIVRSMHQRSGGILPRWITVENVWNYTKFQAFNLLRDGFLALGYCYCIQELDAADFGVPQHRKRMWARFALATAAPRGTIKTRAGGMIPRIEMKLPYVGWYHALAHLILDLPPSEFAEWQIKKLLVKFQVWHEALERRPTVEERLKLHQAMLDTGSFIIPGSNWTSERLLVTAQNPSYTLKALVHPEQVFLAQSNTFNACLVERDGAGSKGPQIVAPNEPSFTVRGLGGDRHCHQMSCWLVDGKFNSSGTTVTARRGDRPSYATITSSHKQSYDLWMPNAEVRAVTPDALWELQMYRCPRPYHWPDGTSNVTKCRGIGNGVPYLMGLEVKQSLVGKQTGAIADAKEVWS